MGLCYAGRFLFCDSLFVSPLCTFHQTVSVPHHSIVHLILLCRDPSFYVKTTQFSDLLQLRRLGYSNRFKFYMGPESTFHLATALSFSQTVLLETVNRGSSTEQCDMILHSISPK